uniref:Uncharacterized protein n=1 Tax=Caenorhabditis japonica TaxID=281687 RepID=A0A8R1I7F4_CAEJA
MVLQLCMILLSKQERPRGYDHEESEARTYYDIDERLVRLGTLMETFATVPTIVIDNYTDGFVNFDFHGAKRDHFESRQKKFRDAVVAAATDFTLPEIFVQNGTV